MRIFVAGATGAIGQPLVRQLIEAGHDVTGMTRSPAKATWLREAGAGAVVCDALDAQATKEAVHACGPEVVIDQLTDLPQKANPFRFNRFYDRQNQLKTKAPLVLLEAAVEVGARRHIMQGVAFTYDPGASSEGIHAEDDPQYKDPPKPWDEALPPFAISEQRVIEEPSLEGIVLRYGFFYGPGTHMASDGSLAADVRRRRYPIVGGGGVYSFIHVADAAGATLLAAEAGKAGAYNVVDDKPLPVREWLPSYAEALGAKPPRRVPAWLARLTTGPIPTHFSTTLRGASNAKLRESLEWEPEYPDPREGFVRALG